MTDENMPIVDGVTFKRIEGFPRHCVGDDGTIWRRLGRYTRGTRISNTGWSLVKPQLCVSILRIHLWQNNKAHSRGVARLVLEAFVGSCPPEMEARHFPDRDPTNCRLSNLSWATHTENCADRIIHGTHTIGEKNPRAKLTENDIHEIRRLRSTGMFCHRIGSQFSVTESCIEDIVKGRSWKHIPPRVVPVVAGKVEEGVAVSWRISLRDSR